MGIHSLLTLNVAGAFASSCLAKSYALRMRERMAESSPPFVRRSANPATTSSCLKRGSFMNRRLVLSTATRISDRWESRFRRKRATFRRPLCAATFNIFELGINRELTIVSRAGHERKDVPKPVLHRKMKFIRHRHSQEEGMRIVVRPNCEF